MIKWNEYTWYSKWAALIFFLLILPIITFYIGTRYELAKDTLNYQTQIINTASSRNTSSVPITTNIESTSTVESYTSDKYGFTFDYPASGKIHIDNIDSVSLGHNPVVAIDVEGGDFEVQVLDEADLNIDYNDHIYKYISASNTFAVENELPNNSPINFRSCPTYQSFNGKISSYVYSLSGAYTGRGNNDSDFVVLTNKGYALQVGFTDNGLNDSGVPKQIANNFHLINGVKDIKANCN